MQSASERKRGREAAHIHCALRGRVGRHDELAQMIGKDLEADVVCEDRDATILRLRERAGEHVCGERDKAITYTQK